MVKRTEQDAVLQYRLYGSINRIRWAGSDVERLAQELRGADPTVVLARFGGADDMPAGVPAAPATIDAPQSAGGRSYTFTISTEKVDSYGDKITLGGWDLATYRSNPVVLWGHDSTIVPVGRATKTWVADGRLKSTVELAPPDANPAAEQVRKLIEGGFLRASSVGFTPLEWSPAKDKSRPFGLDFTKTRLLEWSVVNIPANADCLIESKSIEDEDSEEAIEYRRRAAHALRLKAGRK